MKVTSAMLAGSLCAILVWLLELLCHIQVPSPVVVSLTTFFTFLVHVLVPEADLADKEVENSKPQHSTETAP